MCIFRATRRIVELAGPKGIAIGFDPAGPTFDKQMEEYEITLGPGDSFALYTDGFTEAMSPTKEEYGEQRFYQTFADAGTKPAKDIVLSILESVNGHRNGAEQSDDLTLLVVRRGGA
jgi:sigma-B regulation protein RsbU (phosphoserine phosphatase)